MSTIAKTATVIVVLALANWLNAQEGDVNATPADRAGKGFLTLSTSGTAQGNSKPFTAQLTPKNAADQPAFGGVTIVGLEGITVGAIGDIDWQISGSTVTGKLVEHGKELGMFVGTISSTGVSGQITMHDGRSGLWSWDGPLPSGAPVDGGGQ